jgi:hypothetical protein
MQTHTFRPLSVFADAIEKSDIKDEHKAMIDGARASCTLASFFALVAFAVTLCDRKFGAVFCSFLVGKFPLSSPLRRLERPRSSRPPLRPVLGRQSVLYPCEPVVFLSV